MAGWSWNIDQLRATFTEAVTGRKSQRTYVFIDALDECPVQVAKGVLDQLMTIIRRAENNGAELRMFFSRRPFLEITAQIPLSLTYNAMKMEDHNGPDIAKYIREKLLSTMDRRHEPRRQKLINHMNNRSNHNFLWASLVVDILNEEYGDNGYHPRRMMKLLDSVPDNLSRLFERLAKNIKKDHLPEAINIVRWILYARRPLTTAELRFAVNFDDHHRWNSQRDYKASDRYIHQRDVEKVVKVRTAGLVEIKSPPSTESSDIKTIPGLSRLPIPRPEDEHSYLNEKLEWKHPTANQYRALEADADPQLFQAYDSDQDSDISSYDSSDDSDDLDESDNDCGQSWLRKKQIVQFFHSSAKQYFMDNGLQVFGVPAKHDSYTENHTILSRSCIDYFRISELPRAGLRLPDNLPFDDDSHAALRRFFRRHPFLCYALHFWDHHAEQVESQSSARGSRKDLLMYFVDACRSLSTKVVEQTSIADSPRQCDKGKLKRELDDEIIAGLLQIAISKNLQSCATSLIEMLSNLRCPRVGVALQTAIRKKTSKISHQLIRAGADVRYKESEGQSLAILAAQNSDAPTMNLLIEAGADINAVDLEGATPLLNAAKLGNTAMIKELCERDALYQKSDTMGCTALHYVAALGHVECASVLIKKGANVNAKDINKLTPLGAAIEAKQPELIKLLLQNGADIAVSNSPAAPAIRLLRPSSETARSLLETREEVTNESRNINGSRIIFSKNKSPNRASTTKF